jgi:hypothetical protein
VLRRGIVTARRVGGACGPGAYIGTRFFFQWFVMAVTAVGARRSSSSLCSFVSHPCLASFGMPSRTGTFAATWRLLVRASAPTGLAWALPVSRRISQGWTDIMRSESSSTFVHSCLRAASSAAPDSSWQLMLCQCFAVTVDFEKVSKLKLLQVL